MICEKRQQEVLNSFDNVGVVLPNRKGNVYSAFFFSKEVLLHLLGSDGIIQRGLCLKLSRY